MKAKSHLIAAFLLLLWPLLAATADQKPLPQRAGRVTDVAKVLSAPDRDRLTAMLARYEKETSHELVVLIVPTLSGESIESFSLRVGNAWRIGKKGPDNGILVTLAMQEQRARIALGSGMQKYITEATADAILKNTMGPAFQKGDFAGGLRAGLEELMKEARRFVVKPGDQKRAKDR